MDFIPDLVTEPISRDPQHWGYFALSCLVTIDASAGEIRVPSLGHACRRGLDHNTCKFLSPVGPQYFRADQGWSALRKPLCMA